MSGIQILPPEPGKCRECAVEHGKMEAHDATSFYYQVWFANAYGRSATWADAIAHCEPEVQQEWKELFESIGIDVNSPDVRGGIKTQAELNQRFAHAFGSDTESDTETAGGEG